MRARTLHSTSNCRALLREPLQPVEFPRRLCVGLCVLAPHWKSHGVPQPNVTSNHPLVHDVLPHLALELRFNLDILQGVHRRRQACLGLPFVSLRKGGVKDRLQCSLWCREGRWRIASGGHGKPRRSVGRMGRGEEGREGCDLEWRQLSDFAPVVNLETCT